MSDLFPRDKDILLTRKRIGGIHNVMNNTEYFLLGQVCRILRVEPYKVIYLITTHQVPEPRLRIGNKRIFTIDDMQRIAAKLQIQLAQDLVDADGNWRSKEDDER
jgi:hypothetical protein